MKEMSLEAEQREAGSKGDGIYNFEMVSIPEFVTSLTCDTWRSALFSVYSLRLFQEKQKLLLNLEK